MTPRKSASRTALPTFITAPGPVADGLRIGLLGGSFNPAHEGHVYASELALKQLHLDYVWWLVSPQNPLKPKEGMAGLKKRLADALTLARNPRIVVTDVETALGTRFTADTIARLQQHFPRIHFVWLMGTDNMVQIPRWKHWRSIFRLLPVAVIAREGSVLQARVGTAARTFATAFRPAGPTLPVSMPPVWTLIDGRRNRLSATAIRAKA